ncbi:MAG: VIT1/CCC1 transporter family protein [Candidatus Baldrarchaeia archaeon]
MKRSLRSGIGFGWTSGIITTLGLMIGLHSGTHSKLVIIGGILTIAIADAFSDALGIHLSEEFEGEHTPKEVREATVFTFISKFFFSITFIVPLLLLPFPLAIVASIIYGMVLLCILSFWISKMRGEPAWKVILEHVSIAIAVVVAAHLIGDWISEMIKHGS